LPHRFTNAQLFYLDRVLRLAEELLPLPCLSQSDVSAIERAEAGEVARNLDKAYLLLCIALLDYTLQGDYFKSVVLSFLAILGIDKSPSSVFRSPLSYSPNLLKFIKIAQMLIIQQLVVAAEEGKIEHPSYMLDKMREQFIV
jgi:hypothetical protein